MQWILSKAIYFIVRVLSSTYRYRYIGLENIEKAKELTPTKNHLLAVWHQNLFQGIVAQKKKHYVVIVSRSKDAGPVAYTCTKLGHKVVRGSSRSKNGVDKGGKLAKDEMIETLKTGIPGAITIDGPKGPAKEVKPGIIDMAIKSNTPIIPYLPIPESFWSFNSWDQFRLPKPFSRIIIFYGKPIDPSVGVGSFDKLKSRLKEDLDSQEESMTNEFSNWKTLSHNNFYEE